MFRSLALKLLGIIIVAPFLLYFVWRFQIIDKVLFPDAINSWQLPTSSWPMAFSPNGEMLGTVSGELIRREIVSNERTQGHPSVEIRRVSDNSVVRSFDFFAADSLAFSPDNTLLAAGGYRGQIDIWRIGDGQKLHSLIGSDEPRSNTLVLAFTPDGQTLVALAVRPYTSETKLNQLSLWNVTNGEKRYSLTGRYTCAAISPDGQLLALGSRNQPLMLHRVSDGTAVRQLQENPDTCFYLTFSPDGKILTYLSKGLDPGIPIYRVEDGKLLYLLSSRIEFYNNFEDLTHIAISPDGRMVAAAYTVLPDASIFIGPSFTFASHGRIRLWQVDNGRKLQTLRGHKGGVSRLTFYPNGELLASTGFDATVRFWRMPPHNYIWLWLLLGGSVVIVLGYFRRFSFVNLLHR